MTSGNQPVQETPPASILYDCEHVWSKWRKDDAPKTRWRFCKRCSMITTRIKVRGRTTRAYKTVRAQEAARYAALRAPDEVQG